VSDDARLRLAFIADPNSLHTRRWIAWFARAGHDVRLIDPFDADIDPGLPDGVALERYAAHRSRIPLVSLFRSRGQLRRLLARLDTQVLHAQFVRRFGWQAAISGFRPRVVSPWGSDILRVPPRAIRTRWWNRFALRSADLITVSSDGMRDASIRAGARPERIRLIHHGVDTTTFAPGPPSAEVAARVAAGHQPVIVSPRTIRPLYRQGVVVDAVAALSTPQRRPVLVLSARGADPGELARLRQQAADAGIGDQLRVLDDIAHDDLPDVFRLADVVVSVPETDSFAVTLLEAMACGRPLVVSDVPAVTPVLRGIDPLAGKLVAPIGDAAATAAAIDRALSLSDAERERMGALLREHVERTADYDANMAEMERLYRRLATQR